LYRLVLSVGLHVTTADQADAMSKKSTREKVRSYRQRMRARGLRPVQVWVPDTRTEAFRDEAHRQSLAVARSARNREDQTFIDAVSDLHEA